MPKEELFKSGYINHRNRKVGIVWLGQWAEHVAKNNAEYPKTHPLLHVRIQQLATKVKEWEKRGTNRFVGRVEDHKLGTWFVIAIDLFDTFASIVTCYKTEVPNG